MKHIAILLSFLLLLALAVPGTAVAAAPNSGTETTNGVTGYTILNRTWPDEAESALVNAIENISSNVDLSSLHLLPEQLFDLLSYINYSYGEFFYYDNSYSYGYNSTGYITDVILNYKTYSRPISELKTELEAAVQQAVDYAMQGDTPLLRALLANDYLCDHIEYDYTYSNHDAYSGLVNGNCVCEGYTKAYGLLLRRMGITNSYASSNIMDHAWNLVQISGCWYHVDVTWNDVPSYRYKYFMHSDGDFEGHDGWEAYYTAQNTDFDSAFWNDCETVASVVGPNVYYMVSNNGTNQILCWNAISGETGNLLTFSTCWWVGTDPNASYGTYYSDYFGTMTVHNGRIYYVLPDGVESIPVSGGVARREMTIPNNCGSIYRCSFSGDVLTYTLGTDYDTLTDTRSWRIGN